MIVTFYNNYMMNLINLGIICLLIGVMVLEEKVVLIIDSGIMLIMKGENEGAFL
jgi:hypothetical protein